MVTIKLIKARGGLSTAERLLQIINQNPNGCTVRQLSQAINRPVSMINICLKTLISKKQVKMNLSNNQMQRIYFPSGSFQISKPHCA